MPFLYHLNTLTLFTDRQPTIIPQTLLQFEVILDKRCLSPTHSEDTCGRSQDHDPKLLLPLTLQKFVSHNGCIFDISFPKTSDLVDLECKSAPELTIHIADMHYDKRVHIAHNLVRSLPQTLTRLSILIDHVVALSDSDIGELPSGLTDLSLDSQSLSSKCLILLPKSITSLNIGLRDDSIDEEDVCNLPPNITDLGSYYQKFLGYLPLSSLQYLPNLTTLNLVDDDEDYSEYDLAKNNWCKNWDFSFLPPGLKTLAFCFQPGYPRHPQITIPSNLPLTSLTTYCWDPDTLDISLLPRTLLNLHLIYCDCLVEDVQFDSVLFPPKLTDLSIPDDTELTYDHIIRLPSTLTKICVSNETALMLPEELLADNHLSMEKLIADHEDGSNLRQYLLKNLRNIQFLKTQESPEIQE